MMNNTNQMYANSINHKLETYEDKTDALDFPKMCVLSFVYVCNALCPGCPYTISDIRDQYKDALLMKSDLFKKIADECGANGSYIRLSGGGEPMMHPQAVELIEYAKSVGAKVGLITNGSIFNEENSRRLLEADIDMIEFSVDACDEQTYSIVRKGLDFYKLVDNVERMVAMRDKLGSSSRIIASVINQKEIDLYEVEAYWKKRVDHVQLRKYLTWGMGDKSQSADDIPYLPEEEKLPCPWLFERLNIDSRGQVTLCGYDIPFNNNLGNIEKRSIKDVWLGEEFTRLRKLHLDGKRNEIEICRNCTDGQYRSWTYNYWQLIKTAEENRNTKKNAEII